MQDNSSDPTTHFVSIHTLSNRFEADLMLDALRKEGIPTFLRSFEETPYDGLFVCQRGWGWIMVAEESSSRALQIIRPMIEDIQSRTIYVDPAEIDPLLWDRLKNSDPQMICKNALVNYDANLASYVISFLGAEFLCSPDRQTIEPLSENPFVIPDFQFSLVLLHHLLEAKPHALSGRWIGEKEIPGGELFFRGPHRLPLEPLRAIFGRQPSLFRKVAERMEGVPVSMGDLAFQFLVMPRIPLLLVLWEGDEEFEPEMLLRFDRSIEVQLEKLDLIYAMANIFSRTIEACAKPFCAERTAG
jgi:hypothetical protein